MKFTHEMPSSQNQTQEILESGWYDFHVVNVYDKDRDGAALITRTGTPWMKIVCEESKGRATIFHALFLAEDNARKISALIHACRLGIEAGEEIDLTAATFMGRSFRGKVEIETGKDGITRNKITRVIQTEEPEEPDSTPLQDEETEKDEVPF